MFVFFPLFFGYLKKTQIVCRGAKFVFWQFVRVSKEGFSKKMYTFCFCLFVLEKKKRNMKNMENENLKKPEK